MEITSLPVPFTGVAYPVPQQPRVIPPVDPGLPTKQNTSRDAREQVLHGEVLGRDPQGKRERAGVEGYTAEGEAHRYSPPIFGSGPADAIEQYLGTAELSASSLNTKPLIDIYV